MTAESKSTPGGSPGNPRRNPLPGALRLDELIAEHLSAFDEQRELAKLANVRMGVVGAAADLQLGAVVLGLALDGEAGQEALLTHGQAVDLALQLAIAAKTVAEAGHGA